MHKNDQYRRASRVTKDCVIGL